MIRLNAPPEILDDEPRLGELMTRRLVGITPDAPAQVALNLMATAGVRHLPVLDGGTCLGMVLESDVVLAVAEGELQRPGAPLRVDSLCRRASILRAHDRRATAALQMCETEIDAVLIVEDGTLIGIVTATDLVHSLAARASAHRPVQK